MLVYVSSAIKLFSTQDLTKLLEKSRQNNSKLDITTGMLLYKDGNFMQFLEGPKENVLGLVDKIKCDPRHRGFMIMLQEEHDHREFEDWAMAFQKLNPGLEREAPGYSEFLDLPLNSEELTGNPSRALRLLMSFKQIVG